MLDMLRNSWRRRRSRLFWESLWSRTKDGSYRPDWLTEAPRGFLVAGFEAGWLSTGMTALEIGCGLGQTAAGLAARGLRVKGIDISREAIKGARKAYAGQRDLTFEVVDVCHARPLGETFDIVIDSGCLHAIHSSFHEEYKRNLLMWSRAGTRFILRMHTSTAPIEQRRQEVQALLIPPFELVQYEEFPSQSPAARERLNPVFHLVRRS